MARRALRSTAVGLSVAGGRASPPMTSAALLRHVNTACEHSELPLSLDLLLELRGQ